VDDIMLPADITYPTPPRCAKGHPLVDGNIRLTIQCDCLTCCRDRAKANYQARKARARA
jgi:hypothetical protein